MSKKEDPGFQPTFQGSGPFGPGNFQETPNHGSPNFKEVPISNITNDFDEGGFSETPRIPEEAGASVTLPFQPRVYQDGNDWYFEFTTSGVVFLPVATGTTDTVWHNHWNESWPFRPTMVDSSGGSAISINDADAFGGSDSRRPRLLLTEGGRNVIYLEVTVTSNEDSISRRPDGTGAYGEGVIIKTPELSLVKSDGTTNNVLTEDEGDTSSGGPSDFESHNHPINPSNFAIKYNSGGSATIHGDGIVHPKSFVPLGERNYFVTTAPEIKVVKANDGDSPAHIPFSVRHNSWANTDGSKKFPWGSIFIDNSSTPSVPRIEWWRFDCPTYNFNNRTVDMGTSPTAGKHPKDHPTTEDDNVADLNITNEDGLGATI